MEYLRTGHHQYLLRGQIKYTVYQAVMLAGVEFQIFLNGVTARQKMITQRGRYREKLRH